MYRKVSLASVALIVGEALVLTALLMSHLSGSVSQAIAASTLVSGDLSLQFWLIVVIVGLADSACSRSSDNDEGRKE